MLAKDPTFRATEQTRERIRAVARELGYVSDARARQLRQGTSPILGVLAQDIGGAYAGPLFQRLSVGLVEMNKEVLLGLHLGDMKIARHHIDVFRAYRTFAVLIISRSGKTEDEVIEMLHRGRRECGPAVAACFAEPASQIPSLTIDFDWVFREFIQTLFNDGRRTAILAARSGGSFEFICSRYREVLSQTPHMDGEVLHVPTTKPDELARQVAPVLRDRCRAGPIGAMVTVDTDAIFIAQELKRIGVSVPEEVAIVGYGNHAFSLYSTPKITTFDVLGTIPRMANKVLDLLRDLDGITHPPIKEYAFRPPLIIQESFVPSSGAGASVKEVIRQGAE